MRDFLSMRTSWPVIAAMAFVADGCRTGPEKPVVMPSPAPLAELWAPPADLASRDVFHGEGGPSLAPDPRATYTYLKRKTGHSPGYTVKDPNGLHWSVKMGVEAPTEVAVSRLLWAIGYRQPPVYFLPSWTLAGGPEPGRQGPARFRPHLPGWRERGEWHWRKNPFVGSPPLRGLIVFMRIVNNWDIHDGNNMIYELDRPREGVRRFYVAQDLGASFGRTTLFPHQGTKGDVEDFERQAYIDRVDGSLVHFDDKGRRHRDLYRNVTVGDVRWTSGLLAKLSDRQWQDAFRAAGYDEPTAGRYIRKLKEKVEFGRRLQ